MDKYNKKTVFVNIVVVSFFQFIQKKNLLTVGRPRHRIGEEKLFPLFDDEGYLGFFWWHLKEMLNFVFLFLLKDSKPPIDEVTNYECLLTNAQGVVFSHTHRPVSVSLK